MLKKLVSRGVQSVPPRGSGWVRSIFSTIRGSGWPRVKHHSFRVGLVIE